MVLVLAQVDLRTGLFCDPVGSGKTLPMAMLMAYNQPKKHAEFNPSSEFAMQGFAIVSRTQPSKYADTSILVVGHHLVSQWVETFKDIIGMKPDVDYQVYRSFFAKPDKKKRKMIEDEDEPEETIYQEKVDEVQSSKYRIVIMTATAYAEFCKATVLQPGGNLHYYKRIVIDEADSIAINNFIRLPSHFLWLMTATSQCFETSSRNRSESNTRATIWALENIFKLPTSLAKSAENTKLTRHTQRDIVETHETALSCAIVENEKSFISETIKIPKPSYNLLRKHELLIQLRKSSWYCLSAEANIVSGRSMGTYVPLVKRPYMHHDKYPLPSILEDRCVISLEKLSSDARHNVRLPCCNQQVLVSALKGRLAFSDDPPCTCCGNRDMALKFRELVADFPEVTAMRLDTVFDKFSEIYTAAGKIKNAIDQDATTKVLVFEEKKKGNNAEKSSPFYVKPVTICDILDKMGISNERLKGRGDFQEKLIAKFQNGAISVLVLYTDTHAAGLNLQVADMIVCLHRMPDAKFTQLVGRAQRPGRKTGGDGESGRLCVWHHQDT